MARARARDRTSSGPMSETDLARRRLRRFVYVVTFAILAVFVGTKLASRSAARPKSVVVSKHGRPWRITKVPTNVTATYLIDTRAGGKSIVNTERVWIRRPF